MADVTALHLLLDEASRCANKVCVVPGTMDKAMWLEVGAVLKKLVWVAGVIVVVGGVGGGCKSQCTQATDFVGFPICGGEPSNLYVCISN